MRARGRRSKENSCMDDYNDTAPSGFPSVRIWLCGTFHIEWIDPATGYASPFSDENLHGKGVAQTLSLLKLLLCQPGRQAHRDWIMEQFWPDHTQSSASHRLHNIASVFRKLLCPPDGLPLLPYISGKQESSSVYALPAYPRLWVDSDAIAWNIEQAARMERFGDDALPFWQRAFDLLKRGLFLADEPYAAWAQAKRTELEGYYRQCVHALSRLYLARYGDAGKSEALLLLQTYWQQHPTDEDALRPLMEFLGEQERYKEVEACYQQCCLALTELGRDEDGQPRKPDARTQDLREYLRTKQLRRERAIQSDIPRPTSRAVSLERQILGSMLDPENSIQGLSGATPQHADYTMSRREAGKTIATIGASFLTVPMFSLMQVGAMLHDEEILAICTTSLPILWRLYFDGQLSEVRRILPGYLSQLALLVRQPSGYQQRAAHVASKAHQLACMLALQEQDYGLALVHVDQAIFGANIAEDTHLQVASLIRKALVYRYLKWFKPMLETYQEADQYSKRISPLLQGRLYTGLAEAHSNFEREYEARHFLDLAYTTFPENSKEDPNFSYTHFKLPQGFEAVMYLNLKQAEKAWESLAKIDASVPMAAIPDRVELSIDQARASLLLGDMIQSCKYVEFAATSASALGSHLRYNEAYNLYQQMQMQWPREQQVKALAGHFQ